MKILVFCLALIALPAIADHEPETAPAPRRVYETAQVIQDLASGDYQTREAAQRELARRVPRDLALLREARATHPSPEARRRLHTLIAAYDPIRFENWNQVIATLGELAERDPAVGETSAVMDSVFRVLDPDLLAALRGIYARRDRLRDERDKTNDGKRFTELLDQEMALEREAGKLKRDRLAKVKIPDRFTLMKMENDIPAYGLQPDKPTVFKLGDALRARFGAKCEGFILPDGKKLDEKTWNDFPAELHLNGDSYDAQYGAMWKYTIPGTGVITSINAGSPYPAISEWLKQKYPTAVIPRYDPMRTTPIPARHPTAGRPWRDPGPIN